VPDVPVSLNNREVARTGWLGKALVPDLRSYRTNKISINPLDLPIESNIGASAMNVVPARRSGVTVDFGGQPNAAALVVLHDTAGQFFSPGADVSLQGTGSSFVVGYDGEVWIEGLEAQNRILVQTGDITCSAEFIYIAHPGAQVYIDGIECK
jgi:outer membrane usher protein